MRFTDPLPIDDVLDPLLQTLEAGTRAVLVAPPGAGKTTRVPLALLDAPWAAGKRILVLEPRRLAARAAAQRLAETCDGQLGGIVGLRVRLESRIGPKTRIEVITEGIFTRMILDDPELADVAAVVFDEFHERSLDADLGLALVLEAQQNFNSALRILVMSATLDGARVAGLLQNSKIIESEGRSYPVETRYRPRDPQQSVDDAVYTAIMEALSQDEGSLLVFLPGQAEIIRMASRLADVERDGRILVAPLYGVMDPKAQDQAIKPCLQGRRKIVLATSIAETSLTIEDVRIVIDSGLSRVPRYEPDLGLTRLETVRVSRASADQRRGRAGRVAAGIAYRLWAEAADGALEPFQKPEILTSDLSALLLDCAAWGERDPRRLAFLDPPPEPALKEANAMLVALGAFDPQGRMTDLGAAIRSFGRPAPKPSGVWLPIGSKPHSAASRIRRKNYRLCLWAVCWLLLFRIVLPRHGPYMDSFCSPMGGPHNCRRHRLWRGNRGWLWRKLSAKPNPHALCLRWRSACQKLKSIRFCTSCSRRACLLTSRRGRSAIVKSGNWGLSLYPSGCCRWRKTARVRRFWRPELPVWVLPVCLGQSPCSSGARALNFCAAWMQHGPIVRRPVCCKTIWDGCCLISTGWRLWRRFRQASLSRLCRTGSIMHKNANWINRRPLSFWHRPANPMRLITGARKGRCCRSGCRNCLA